MKSYDWSWILVILRSNKSFSRVFAIRRAWLTGTSISCSSVCRIFFLLSIICRLLSIILLLNTPNLVLNSALLHSIGSLSICTWMLLHLVHHLLEGLRIHAVLRHHLVHHYLIKELLLMLVWSSSHRACIRWKSWFIVVTWLKLGHLRIRKLILMHVSLLSILKGHLLTLGLGSR